MATPHGYDDSSVMWTNRIGESCTVKVRITWIDEDCRFVSKPSITTTITGGTTFSTFWAYPTLVSEYKRDECECVQLRITFGGVFKYLLKFQLSESSLDYVICADGSGQARQI